MGSSRRNVLLPVLAAALATATSCANPMAPDPDGSDAIRVAPIQIDSVTVVTGQFSASAHVRGVVGDGCSAVSYVDQTRRDNVVTLTILGERPVDAVCTQIARLYDETLVLEGSYPPGRYTLKVNGFEVSFETP